MVGWHAGAVAVRCFWYKLLYCFTFTFRPILPEGDEKQMLWFTHEDDGGRSGDPVDSTKQWCSSDGGHDTRINPSPRPGRIRRSGDRQPHVAQSDADRSSVQTARHSRDTWQLSDDADGPARRCVTPSRPPRCTQSWTLIVINWWQSSVDYWQHLATTTIARSRVFSTTCRSFWLVCRTWQWRTCRGQIFSVQSLGQSRSGNYLWF